jgi:hypothetical protein
MEPLEQHYAQGRFGRFAPTATVEIAAPVDAVWRILVDFRNYGAWNRFTPSVDCSGEPGSVVDMQVCFPGAKPMRQVEVLNVFEPPHRLAWGVIMASRVFLVANRYQMLEAVGPDRTRYTTIDYVSGLLAPIVNYFYSEPMWAGFQLAADGLKAHAEAEMPAIR